MDGIGRGESYDSEPEDRLYDSEPEDRRRLQEALRRRGDKDVGITPT